MARTPEAWAPAIGQPADNRFERELVTPEGVDLRLRLAEASERAAAFLLDAAIMAGILVALTAVAIGATIGAGGKGASSQIIMVIWLLGFFLLRNAYFILFELTPRAATPGKRALGLRVAARNGGRLTADAIFARNAMRELEVFLPLTFLVSRAGPVDTWLNLLGIAWCSIFVFFPLFNRDRLRVGDLVAGTWVVKTPQRKLMADVAETAFAAQGDFDFTQAQVDAYGAKELQVLEEVLRRMEARTIAAVAERIRGKIGWTRGPIESDYAFLDAYYLALRARLESRLLFGRRRRDKYDKA
ncbi:MAG TPA: RDD family protein [Caulobacteraceae bacterium]|nr:RDD family protein [Caulobacteraceae bacterium]